MDHDEVQVGHRRLDDNVDRGVLRVELRHQLVHELGYPVGRRSLVDDPVRRAVADEDGTGPPVAGVLRQVVVEHHEVEGVEELARVGELW